MDNKVIDRVGEYKFSNGLQHSEKSSIREGIHLQTGVKVRLKTIRGQNVVEHERDCHLSREATILAHLSHPNIIHVYQLIKHADLQILVTEWIDGLAFAQFMDLFKTRRLPEAIARLYFRQLTSAIIAMQSQHILMRQDFNHLERFQPSII
ncbi:unnamed protein product [Mesocestoides corti]|uniref:Protein kinase domain-containing protein n=2 Tax=Mesocestoides corti TaxID=53468 RepID=A0A0R3UAZ7_MESCO|nr:unnamed protein product [Mesocestoides corti]